MGLGNAFFVHFYRFDGRIVKRPHRYRRRNYYHSDSCNFFRPFPENGAGDDTGFTGSPIGILAAWTYYKEGFVDFPIAALMCAGFVFGGLIGAKFAVNLSNQTLERIFGIALLIISLKMIFAK